MTLNHKSDTSVSVRPLDAEGNIPANSNGDILSSELMTWYYFYEDIFSVALNT